MKKTLSGLVFMTLVSSAPAPAQVEPWHIESCTAEEKRGDLAARRKLQEAKPGSLAFSPRPFPKTDTDVVADFRHHFDEIWGGSKQLDAARSLLRKTIVAGEAQFQVEKVTDWRPNRCAGSSGRRENNPFYFVIRVFDSEGNEVGRAALRASGALSTLAVPSADSGLPEWQGLNSGKSVTENRAGRALRDPQYVTSHGSVHCSVINPCVATRAGNDFFIREKNRFGSRVFRGSSASERIPPETARSPEGIKPLVDQVKSVGQSLASAGRSFVVLEEVGDN